MLEVGGRKEKTIVVSRELSAIDQARRMSATISQPKIPPNRPLAPPPSLRQDKGKGASI
ncbi:MAG: hypothetical protein AB8B68_03265 [Rickettsiaceae bacterium]